MNNLCVLKAVLKYENLRIRNCLREIRVLQNVIQEAELIADECDVEDLIKVTCREINELKFKKRALESSRTTTMLQIKPKESEIAKQKSRGQEKQNGLEV